MFKKNILKNWQILVLVVVILLSFFLRSYNFQEWLYFEADQARNAKNAVAVFNEGFKELPLLGPKAGGTDFHLGPISYYFEYLSGVIFGFDSPEVFAYSNFFFLILSIPLFYYFLRNFFIKKQSLLVTILFSFSYLATQYSRFSWNPNSIIFWGLLFLLGIYKTVTVDNKKKAGLWLLVTALSYGVSSQLHTLSLLGYPIVFGLFIFLNFIFQASFGELKEEFISSNKLVEKLSFLFKWIKKYCSLFSIRIIYWFFSLIIILIIYIPLIIFDIKNKGYNFISFLEAFSAKSEPRGFFEKIVKVYEVYGEYYVLALTSFNKNEIKHIELWGGIFILIAFILIGFLFVKVRKKIEFSRKFSSFIFLIISSFLVFFLMHFQLAFDIDQPRFWFPVFSIPYVFLAIIFYFLWDKKMGKIVIVVICGFILFFNLTAILNWYGGMKNQDEKNILGREISSSSLIQNDFIGYKKMKEAVIWIKDSSEKKSACFNSPTTYLASYKYIFDTDYPEFEVKRINKKFEMSLMENCDIFIIDHGGNSKKEIIDTFRKKGLDINLVNYNNFGLIGVWEVGSVEEINNL